MVSNILLRDQQGTPRPMATDKDSAGTPVHRPVHHSEVVEIQALKTRPANASAYAAGQLIGDGTTTLWTWDLNSYGLERGGLLIGATLTRQTAGTNLTTRFRLHLHDAVPASYNTTDRSDHPLLWANRVSRRGYVDFSSPNVGDSASGNDCQFYVGTLSNPQGILITPTDGIARGLLATRDAIATSESGIGYLLELQFIL